MRFDATPKVYLQTTIGALIAVGAYFQASGVSQLVGATLLVAPALEPSNSSKQPEDRRELERGDHQATSARAILANDPFDSTWRGGSGGPTGHLLDAGETPACGGGGRALIVVAAPNADESLAFVSAAPSDRAKLVRVGDHVEGKTVEIIEWTRIVLASPGGRCELRMFAPQAREKPLAPPANPELISPELAKIERVSATEYNVDHDIVERILQNPAEWMKIARLVPEMAGGKTVGIRLLDVRPDSLLGVLGLENGDRLETINGFDITNPEQAMEAFARLRRATELTVHVNRRGKEVNLDYRIR